MPMRKAFAMIKNFFDLDLDGQKLEVENGGTLCLGTHNLTFVFAPMVHWPEVMVTYDSTDKVLFSADGFGKFGALDVDEDWDDEARRYFIGIVGKYGAQVQNSSEGCRNFGYPGDLSSSRSQFLPRISVTTSVFMIPGLPIPLKTEGIVIAYTSVLWSYQKGSCKSA